MKKRILHFHVKKKWWKLVKLGAKIEEYRVIKPYWTKRLEKDFDEIYYWLGYTKKKLIFKYRDYTKKFLYHPEFGKNPVHVYAFILSPNKENRKGEKNVR